MHLTVVFCVLFSGQGDISLDMVILEDLLGSSRGQCAPRRSDKQQDEEKPVAIVECKIMLDATFNLCLRFNLMDFFLGGQPKHKEKRESSAGLVKLSGQYDGKAEKSGAKDERFMFSSLSVALAQLVKCQPVGLIFLYGFSSLARFLIWLWSMAHLFCSASGEQRRKRGGSLSGSPLKATLGLPALAKFCVPFLLFCCCFCGASAGVLNKTNQELPSACYDWIIENDCASKDFLKEWEELNSRCCSAFPGTVLHCQKGYLTPAERGQYNFPACLPDENVPAGQTCRLDTDHTEKPELKKLSCNSSAEFEDADRNSSGVTYPYCTKPRSRCNRVGQVKLCNGGPSADDLCTCRVGYLPSPRNRLWFTGQDASVCEPMACPIGLCPGRTPAQEEPVMCKDLKLDGSAVHFSCTACPSTAPNVTDNSGTVAVETTPPSTSGGTPQIKAVDDMAVGSKVLLGLCFIIYIII